jgi:hypothetical protein
MSQRVERVRDFGESRVQLRQRIHLEKMRAALFVHANIDPAGITTSDRSPGIDGDLPAGTRFGLLGLSIFHDHLFLVQIGKEIPARAGAGKESRYSDDPRPLSRTQDAHREVLPGQVGFDEGRLAESLPDWS